jgi:E3 ubiquitin-protein ligase MARCH4/9/11
MSFEGGHGSSRSRGAESGDTEPPPPPPGEPAPVPAAPRYPPPLPVSPEHAAGLVEPPGEVAPRRRGADDLPPPPLALPPAGQEVSAAGDCGEGPRCLPEAAAPEAAAGKPEAVAGGEGERRGAGDQPETRSVCSSRSSSSGSGEPRVGHQHQHHQPICKICFQGAEQVRPGGTRGRGPFSTADSARLAACLGFGRSDPAF